MLDLSALARKFSERTILLQAVGDLVPRFLVLWEFAVVQAERLDIIRVLEEVEER